METIVLASSSPRRRELLSQLGIPFYVVVPEVDETFSEGDPADQVRAIAEKKVRAAITPIGREADKRQLDWLGGNKHFWILGADTVVLIEDTHGTKQVIGKPKNREHAQKIIQTLSGRAHTVLTGVCLYKFPGKKNLELDESVEIETAVATTTVWFAELSQDELEWYVSTAEWQGVAGAYRIQQRGAALVQRIDGSFSNVMGLPLRLIYGILGRHLYPFMK